VFDIVVDSTDFSHTLLSLSIVGIAVVVAISGAATALPPEIYR
jgi:hypothetical protein